MYLNEPFDTTIVTEADLLEFIHANSPGATLPSTATRIGELFLRTGATAPGMYVASNLIGGWVRLINSNLALDVVGETPAGLVNGSNATYTTAFNFDPASVEVYVNGIRQKLVTHFNTSGLSTIILGDSPQTGDLLQVNYERA